MSKIKNEDKSKIYLAFLEEARNIYENASLFKQNRLNPESYKNQFKENIPFENDEGVADFISSKEERNKHWKDQNEKFLKYHKSLTPDIFFSSIPLDHYIGERTGLHKLKDKVVLDIGGGTGHFLKSFFWFPESLTYYLIDPNVRLLHDQFIRMYPQLLELEMRHVRAYSEQLPFKNNIADLVVSSSSIDHMDDYISFLSESFRCLRDNGKILISSHLSGAKAQKKRNWGLVSILELITKRLYRLKSGVAINDHTREFSSTQEIELEMKKVGFKVLQSEVIKSYFFIVGQKMN